MKRFILRVDLYPKKTERDSIKIFEYDTEYDARNYCRFLDDLGIQYELYEIKKHRLIIDTILPF